MRRQFKRLRQRNLFESFAFCKRPKIQQSTLDGNPHKQDRGSTAAEERIGSSVHSDTVLKISDCEVNKDSSQMDEEICHSLMLGSRSDNKYSGFPVDSQFTEKLNLGTVNSDNNSSSQQKSVDVPSAIELCSRQHVQVLKASSSPEDFAHQPCLQGDENYKTVLPKLELQENHFIMFSLKICPGEAPHPYPKIYTDKWDSDHVRMPCSPWNQCIVEDVTGKKETRSRWELICQSLNRNIKSSLELEEAIMRYNSEQVGKWNFLGLHTFFDKCFKEEQAHFFKSVLPSMIKMTLDLPNICTQPIPLLKKDQDRYLTLSQKQIGCLLLNAFFCTFPERNNPRSHHKSKWKSEYCSYPDINFIRLFYGKKNWISTQYTEKLKCLFNYFQRITSEEPSGTMTFHRQYLTDLPMWHESNKALKGAVIKSHGFIETDGHGMLQVDFADMYIGGLVLSGGCVQEEIRFVICPELIVSRLFVERIGDTEAIIITGVEQYNKYSGYSRSFRWQGDFKDKTPRDLWGRRLTQVVAIDALDFRNPVDQYNPTSIKRELNKAYCGFYENSFPDNLPAVATGNWGCGVFRGNPNLKFLIQLMAASQADRNIAYFTFGDESLERNLRKMYNFLIEKCISVGDLGKILMEYWANTKLVNNECHPSLYDFIFSALSKKEICTKEAHKNTEDGHSLQ